MGDGLRPKGDAMPSASDSLHVASDPPPVAPWIGPKVAASAVLVGAVLAAFVMPALTLKLEGGLNSFVARPAPTPVRIVDADKRAGIPCAQQTWPYIDAHCLKPSNNKIASSDRTANTATTSAAAPDYGPPVVDAPKADSKTEMAKLETMPQPGPAAATPAESVPPGPVLARVPLPLPRPVAADDEDEYLPPPPVERRQARPRRYHGDPRDRLVRDLNRIIPFGILRF